MITCSAHMHEPLPESIILFYSMSLCPIEAHVGLHSCTGDHARLFLLFDQKVRLSLVLLESLVYESEGFDDE